MRVAIRKFDGKILEAQSDDEVSMDALIQNVIEVRGYAECDVEFTVIPDDEVYERIKSQNEARKPYRDKRKAEYEKRGVTIESLVVAMFEKDDSEIQRLQSIRSQVKKEIPKE